MKLYNIVFSPTGGTQKVATLLTDALKGEAIYVDLADSKQNFYDVQLTQEDVAIISVPSYAGRVPAVVIDRLSCINGHNARTILVCAYGNRSYEDTLVELEDTAKQSGFKVIAAISAVVEHSIAHQFATGRPDEQDSQQPTDPIKKVELLAWYLFLPKNVPNVVYVQQNVLCRLLIMRIPKRYVK